MHNIHNRSVCSSKSYCHRKRNCCNTNTLRKTYFTSYLNSFLFQLCLKIYSFSRKATTPRLREPKTVKLNNGIDMPILGLGTWTLNNEEAEEAVYVAIKNVVTCVCSKQ